MNARFIKSGLKQKLRKKNFVVSTVHTMLNGLRPDVVTAQQRRKVDIKTLFPKILPDLQERLVNLEKDGYQDVEGYFQTKRGLLMGTRSFIPPETILDSVDNTGIIYCHGYANHLRWLSCSDLLSIAEKGFFVSGMEIEGHGLSDTTAGLIQDINLVVEDTHEYIKDLQSKYPMKRWFLFGRSMGGMITLLESIKASEKKDIQIDGMVLIAPMCKIAETVQPHPMLVGLLKALSKTAPSLSVTPSAMNPKLVFKDETFIDKAMSDPIKYVGKPRLATANTLYESTIWLEKNLKKIKTPFFVIHGTKDVVTPYEGSEELYENSSVDEKDKEIYLAKDALHGLLLAEPKEDNEFHWKMIFDWISSRK